MTNVVELKSKGVTICTQCVNFLNLEPYGPREDYWYNHLCKASPLPTKVNPYNGKIQPYDWNDLGTEFFAEEKFKHCRYVNNGTCPKFAKKDTQR